MDVGSDIDTEEFQQGKRRRMSAINNAAPPPAKVAPASAPGVHEVATFLAGPLEFDHELDNEVEELVKDLEFGICLVYGGDQIIEAENDGDIKARAQMLEELMSLSCSRPSPAVLRTGKSSGLSPTPSSRTIRIISFLRLLYPCEALDIRGSLSSIFVLFFAPSTSPRLT
jgi:hypothetical protein